MNENYEPVTGEYRGISNQRNGFITVGLKVTNRCNLDCYHCCRYYELGDMQIGKAMRIVDNLSDGGVLRVNLTGGEPLLYKELPELLEHLKSKKGLSTSLTTNGVILDRYKAGILASHLDNIKISLFSLEENYGLITGGNEKSYRRVLDGISYCVEKGLPVHIQTSVLEENKARLEEMVGLCESIGVSKITFYTNIEQAKGHELPFERKVPDSEVERLFLALLEKREIEKWGMEVKLVRWPQKGQYILIFGDGTVTANPTNNPPNNFEVVGNALDESVEDLWGRYPHKDAHMDFYCSR